MKRIGSMLLAIIGIAVLFRAPVLAVTPGELTAESAVLIDADTGQVLVDKNKDAKRHPASITKIMTGLLTVELAAPDEIATVSEGAVEFPYDVSHIALTPGEEIPVDSLLYALMLQSANDAANVLAEHIDGTQTAFARRMTERAREIGAVNTNFSNPHGLDEPFHLTTAYDMALITREAIQNEKFLHYFGTQRHTIPGTNKQPEERPFTNGQHMLLPDQSLAYDEAVIGGKVGFTDEAKHTMSTAAREDGRTLIAVVLGCGYDEKYYDTEALLAYGFDELVSVPLPTEAFANLPATAMTRQGERVGEITYHADGAPDTVLLPAGMSAADIAYEYKIPQSLEAGQEPGASIQFRLAEPPGNGVPELLLELPLTGSVPAETLAGGIPVDVKATPVLPGSVEPESESGVSFGRWYLVMSPVIAVPLLLVGARQMRIKKLRIRRMRRMERVRNSRIEKSETENSRYGGQW